MRPVLKFTTRFTGRAYRGRIYLPSPSITYLEVDGSVGTAHTGKVEQFMAALGLQFAINGTIWDMVILHANRIPKPFVDPTSITGHEATGKWGSIHRSGDYGQTNTDPF